MKSCRRIAASCGCPKPPFRPAPPEQNDFPERCGGYLTQKIIACGRINHRKRYPLCLSCLPCQARPPFAVLSVCCDGAARVLNALRPCGSTLCLALEIPISVLLRDNCGRQFRVTDAIREELPLTFAECAPDFPMAQPLIQCQVRLSGRCCPRGESECELPLDVCVQGYMLSPCPPPRDCHCPPRLPWYPEPIVNPYCDW